MKIRNTDLKIVKADIKVLSVDAVVEAAEGGSIVNQKGSVKIGESTLTKAEHSKARYTIRTTLSRPSGQTDETKIRVACKTALLCAHKFKLKSIAFPALDFCQGNFPLVGVAKIMTQEILKYLRENETTLTQVIFCLSDEKTFRIFNKSVRSYVEHLLYKFTEGPFVTVDAIIEFKNGVVLIERSNPPYGLALPGGFVDYGESLEEAVVREAKEETNLKLTNLRQFHTYSKPERDPRFHTIGTVFIAKGIGRPQSGDDAKGLKVISYKDLLKFDYSFDHKEVIKDYLKAKKIKDNGRKR